MSSIELREQEVIDIQTKKKVERYYIETNKTPAEIAEILDIKEQEVLIYAKDFREKIVKTTETISNSNVSKRIWTKTEIEFLNSFQNELTVKEASLILRRSRYGTYLKVRQLGLRNMIE